MVDLYSMVCRYDTEKNRWNGVKWITHEAVTGTFAYMSTGSVMLTACAMAGAVLPDWIEGDPLAAMDYKTWRGRHRRFSHWPLLYVFLLFLLYTAWPWNGSDFQQFFSWVFIGALCHIAEDSVCGKVPLLTPGSRVGWKLFTVGSFTEYILGVLLVLLIFTAGALLPAM